MRAFTTLLLTIVTSSFTAAQNPDVISGATLKKEYLESYLKDPGVRRIYNNDNFDNQASLNLLGNLPEVVGEIMNPGYPLKDNLNMREVVVKELLPGDTEADTLFMGAFCYSGYSISDLLKDFVITKDNKDQFGLNHDLYVVIENSAGDVAVFSWGELFYSKRGKDIILAVSVRPVFPTNSDDSWEIPPGVKVVAANDYLTVRNIENPTKITILSSDDSFNGKKGDDIYSPKIIITGEEKEATIDELYYQFKEPYALKTVFFGIHKGFRRLSTFKGVSFSDILCQNFRLNSVDLQRGILTIGSRDGYRVLYSVSEIVNRTDLEEVLIIDGGENIDGRFMIYPSADFFADRFLKGAERGFIKIIK